jgi:hypothetical protein
MSLPNPQNDYPQKSLRSFVFRHRSPPMNDEHGAEHESPISRSMDLSYNILFSAELLMNQQLDPA